VHRFEDEVCLRLGSRLDLGAIVGPSGMFGLRSVVRRDDCACALSSHLDFAELPVRLASLLGLEGGMGAPGRDGGRVESRLPR
jgi:hypothetical protein